MQDHTPVLIVGGSLNGLSLALLLSHRGVPCTLVERHPRTSIQYKFRGISPRSMEIYRSLGIEAEIRARDLIDDRSACVGRMTNLADEQVAWQGIPWSDTSDLGPAAAATCDQDQLEPILRTHAGKLGADIRFNCELVSFTQDADGVTARIRDRGGENELSIRAQYLIGADGTDSPVREALGIRRHGPGVLQHWMNVIFEADLPATIDGRLVRSMFVTDINGALVPRGDGRWLMAIQYVAERGERPEDFTPDRCRDLIRRGAGRPDLKVEVVDARPWTAAALVADRYRRGRVFLVGDSAHVMPPTGGFGGNTGIQDAHNIAWKLDAVVRGIADSRLLESYDAERRPVADRTVAQALARLQAWFKDPGRRLPPPEPIADDAAVMFGYRYPTGAFVAERETPASDLFDDPRTPTGLPGTRAPQLIVAREDTSASTIDLFAGKWVLFAGPRGAGWGGWLRRTSAFKTVGIELHTIEPAADEGRQFSTKYGVADDGAVIVRPDGFIAWRRHDAAGMTAGEIDAAFGYITGGAFASSAATAAGSTGLTR
jgi:2-polyprenyl-6-methoxyphenol hydroxylase-like FAD-dependent oxidoreductase